MVEMSQKQEPSQASGCKLIEAEYTALREELLKHIEVQYVLVGITLTAAAAFLTLGTQGKFSPESLMMYPILVIFLAAAWADNQDGIIRIGVFIYVRFEPMLDKALQWEHASFLYYDEYRRTRWVPLHMLAMRGVFVVPQVLVMLLVVESSLPRGATLSVALAGLFLLDVLSVIITLLLLTDPRKRLDPRKHPGGWPGSTGDTDKQVTGNVASSDQLPASTRKSAIGTA